MKGTSVPKEVKSSTEVETSGGATSSSSKRTKKEIYEKQLEDINKELLSKLVNVNSANGKGSKKHKIKPEQEIILLEQKCVLLLRLKRNKEVIDDGYSSIGRMGANIVIYKCILIALVRLMKPEDDIIELLQAWKKATPKCSYMLDTKRKFDGYLAALRSGMKYSDIFSNIEEALNFNADSILCKQLSDTEEKRWRFRAPPPRHTTFSLCPRSTASDNSCIYGEECLFAHSMDELKEWKLRVEIDKKDSNSGADDAIDICNRSNKKRPIPNVYRSLLIPPLCIHYLLDLGKKIKECAEIQDILTDELPGIKLKAGTPLKYQKRLDGHNKVQCLWSFMVGSKMPMGTVTILHDANREYFRISSGIYYNKKKESISLIELHPNNQVQTKLQVLNTFIQPSLFLRFNYGWPEFCCYKVDIIFESSDPFPVPGLYQQSIVFDFKRDPKAVKNISVEILPRVEPLTNLLDINVGKSVWAATPAEDRFEADFRSEDQTHTLFYKNSEVTTEFFLDKRSDFPSLDQSDSFEAKEYPNKCVGFKNFDVLDSETGVTVNLSGVSLFSSCDSDASGELNLYFSDTTLTENNYSAWMGDFLNAELVAQQKSLNNLKKTVEIQFFGKYSVVGTDSMGKYCSNKDDIFGKLDMSSDMSCDTKSGRLINTSCSHILICRPAELSMSYTKMHRRYLCRIVDKLKSTFIIAVGRKAMDELQLISDSARRLQVQFILEPTRMEGRKRALDGLSTYHMHNILFPDLENNQLPFLKVVDSIGLANDEELLLNSRQMSVYNLVIGRKVLLESDAFSPPLLITGPASTGKTYLLAHGIRALLRNSTSDRSYSSLPSHRILVCTHSDLAADTYIMEYLHHWLINDELSVQRSKPLRIYDVNKLADTVSGVVKHYCIFDTEGTNFRYPTKEEVLSHRIIITTLHNCGELIQLDLEDDTFSHVIIDEATNCFEAECLPPVRLAGRNAKIMLAGDVMQTYYEAFANSTGASPISLLERLINIYPFRHPFIVNLIENYSNHEVIVKFISEMFYNDQLRPASNQPCHSNYYPLSFYSVSMGREVLPENGGGYYNMEEIRAIVEFTVELFRSWPETWGTPDAKDSVVVVTPYINQIIGLRAQLQLKGCQLVNVDAVCNLVGKQYRVVIVSTVRTFKNSVDNSGYSSVDLETDEGFFSDRRLINTALSCAKSLVVAFGDTTSLWSYGKCRDIWRKFLTECHSHQSITGLARDTSKSEANKKESLGLSALKSPPLRPLNLIKSESDRDHSTHLPTLITPFTSIDTDVFKTDSNVISKTEENTRSKDVRVNSVLSSSRDAWSFKTSSLQEAPQTDLFSAFSSDSALYNSTSKSIFNQDIVNAAITPPSASKKKDSLSTYKPREGYRTPFELPSVTTSTSGFAIDIKGLSKNENNSDVNRTDESFSARSHFSEDIVLPTSCSSRPPQTLFENLSPAVGLFNTCKPMGLGNYHTLSHNISPLVRAPPGFASSVPFDFNTGSVPETNIIQTASPYSIGNGNAFKYGFKRNSYELPPRMLRNLHVSGDTSPTHKRPLAQTTLCSEMNFFKELGLDLQTKESSRSTSSTSTTDSSFLDPDETMSNVEEDFSNSTPQSDWIEVRNTKKSKHHSIKKPMPLMKRVSSVSDSFQINSEMSVDDKIELITQMGFSKSQAIKALQSSDKDLQQAVDWLISKPIRGKSSM